MLHIEALPRFDLPLMEAGAAQGETVGPALTSFPASGIELDDVAHGRIPRYPRTGSNVASRFKSSQ